MYYSQIYADPKELDRIYVMNVFAMVSNDGGKTLQRLGERSKHVDNHYLWIDPDNTSHYLIGSDGGLYESYDRAATWDFKENLPITQFYDVTTDNACPSITSTAARRTTSVSAAPRARAAPPASRTPIGSSRRAATAFVRRLTPKTRISSTPNINTAASPASTKGRASASASNRRPGAAKTRCV
jgi:hypothetical protein